jgi:signal peptidase I
VSEQQIPAESEEEHTPKKGSILRETAIILVSALVLSWLLKTFLVQAFYIPSGSMEDTLQENDRINKRSFKKKKTPKINNKTKLIKKPTKPKH